MNKVVLFGGTTEGRKLAEYCSRHEILTLVCVVSDYGAGLVPESPWIRVRKEAMGRQEMEELLDREKPGLVLDCTHPYASAATENIRQACSRLGMDCVRVEREEEQGISDRFQNGRIHWVQNAAEAAAWLSEREGRIFLTTGSKELETYSRIPGFEERVFARVLPDERAVGMCRSLGLKGSRIIAVQGPFSFEMNLALIHMTGADYVVTKESGTAGGFPEKMEAVQAAGAVAVVIGRPPRAGGISLKEAVRLLEPYGKTCRRKVFLTGIGMGGEGQLTGEAGLCIRKADGVAGAGRMLDSIRDLCRGKEIKRSYDPEEILGWLRENPQMDRAAVVYSGDPGFYSGAGAMAKLLEQYEEEYETVVIPGISTVSCLCARLKTGWEDVFPASLHGREQDVEEILKTHRRVFLLMGGKDPLKDLCRRLTDQGRGNLRMAVGIRLSYPEERILTGTVKELEDQKAEGLCAVLLERDK